jgi:hypothetical protein
MPTLFSFHTSTANRLPFGAGGFFFLNDEHAMKTERTAAPRLATALKNRRRTIAKRTARTLNTPMDSLPITGSPAFAAHQWQIVPQGTFSRHFDLLLGGEHVASMRMALWTEGCEFTIAGHEFKIRRTSMWRDGFILATGGQTVCEVRKGFWSRRFELSAADQNWVLQPVGWVGRSYQLLEGEREVGSVRPTGWFTRVRAADFAAEVPPPIQVLAIFLVLLAANRAQRSSAAAGG